MDFNVMGQWIPLDITKLVWDFVDFRDENFYQAVEGGYLDRLKWFHKHFRMGIFCVRSAENAMFRIAARNGHLEILQWLASTFHLTHHDISQYSNAPARWASTKGHLNVLIWLHETYDVPLDQESVRYAAFFGHIHTLEWLRRFVDPKTFSEGIRDALNCLSWVAQTGNDAGKLNNHYSNKLAIGRLRHYPNHGKYGAWGVYAVLNRLTKFIEK